MKNNDKLEPITTDHEVQAHIHSDRHTRDEVVPTSSKIRSLLSWFDSNAYGTTTKTKASANLSEHLSEQTESIDWLRLIPFIAIHIGCLGILFTGVSTTAWVVCLVLYVVRMFAITAFYHRYFSHRAFKTNRFWQTVFAIIGNSAAQRGPLWWAAHHRHHHLSSDKPHDLHSPITHSFWWSHMGWFASKEAFDTPWHRIKDFKSLPELRFLNRFDGLVPLALAVSLYIIGECLRVYAPSLETSGPQLFVWGFCISTVLLFHATASINSLGHLWGSRRFNTSDHSRNNPLLAVITFGEGWHNNHHRWPVSARQGFRWWEVDLTFYGIKALEVMGIVWDVKPVPTSIRIEGEGPKQGA